MEIWDNLFKTDPAYTKAGKVGGMMITSISPMYVIRALTEQFGPAGEGWGYDIVEERFDNGAPIFKKGNGKDTDEVLCFEQLHTVLLEGWYRLEGEKVALPRQFGHTPYIYRSKYGPISDLEAPKKSVSDALKKSFSMIGVGADIFLGMFDDPSYVEQVANESAMAKADDKDAEAVKQQEEYEEWRTSHLKTFSESVSKNEANKLFTLIARKMERHNDQGGLRKLNQIKEELSEKFKG
jgi:hypothetical protein